MKHQKKQFAICVRNEGAEDLEIRKIYQILPDARAAKDKHLRVIDESGEDYLYPADFFVPLTLCRARWSVPFQLLSVKAARTANHRVGSDGDKRASHPKR
jgi:hypothetical protein